MSEIDVKQLSDIEGELCTLGGGIRSIGQTLVTLGRTDGRDTYQTELEDFGHLLVSLSRYCERIAVDLDESIAEAKR